MKNKQEVVYVAEGFHHIQSLCNQQKGTIAVTYQLLEMV